MLYSNETIIHVQQPDGMSCIAACLSMVTMENVGTVCDTFMKDYVEGRVTIPEFLKKYEIECETHLSAGIHTITDHKVHLLCVPSLNTPGMFHQIVLDTRFGDLIFLYDPARGLPNKRYYVMAGTAELNKDSDSYDPLAFPMMSFIIDYTLTLPELKKTGE